MVKFSSLQKFFHKHNLKIIAIAILCVSTYYWGFDSYQRSDTLNEQSQTLISEGKSAIESEIAQRVQTIILLTEMWKNVQNVSQLYDYNRYLSMVPQFYDYEEGFLAINWINESSYIKWVYPYDTNVNAINKSTFYYANGSVNTGFTYAYNNLELGISGYTPFFQGGFGFAIYSPIMHNNTLVGFFNGVINLEVLFDTLFIGNSRIVGFDEYSMDINFNQENIYSLGENFTISDNLVVTETLEIYHFNLSFSIRPIADLRKEVSLFRNLIILIMGVILSVSVYLFGLSLIKRNRQLKMAVDENKKLAEALFVKQKIESLGTLAGGIAHDFNNILAGMLGNIELMKLDLESATEDVPNISKFAWFQEIEEFILDLHASIRRSEKLIKQITEFSDPIDLEFEIIDVVDQIRKTLQIFTNMTDRRIEIHTNFEDSDIYTLGDPVRLDQIILNLLINSRDAVGDSGKISVSCQIGKRKDIVPQLCSKEKIRKTNLPRIIGYSPDHEIIIEVEDNGCGIPQDDISRIFDPFFTTKRQDGRGTGLGLTVVFNNIQALKGNMTVESEVGKGTIFSLHIPLLLLKDSYPRFARSENNGSVNSTKTLEPASILLVEDDISIGHGIQKFLQLQGMTIILENNGIKGLESYKKFQSDLKFVILDINLPGLNGIQLYNKIQALNPSQKILFITGYSEEKFPPFDENILGVLKKPFAFEKLLEILSTNQ